MAWEGKRFYPKVLVAGIATLATIHLHLGDSLGLVGLCRVFLEFFVRMALF